MVDKSRDYQELLKAYNNLVRENDKNIQELIRFRKYIDNLADPVMLFYEDSLMFFYCNNSALAKYGYT